MQAAERGDALGARPQHQMIGVAEHDLGAGRRARRPASALHGRLRADRHECRRLHFTVRGHEFAAAGGPSELRRWKENAWGIDSFVMAGPVPAIHVLLAAWF